MEYTREEIRNALHYIQILNSYHIVGQNYLDITFFNEILAKAFYQDRVFLYPKGRVAGFIGRYSAKIQGIEIIMFLMEEQIGYLCVGLIIGPHSTFLNKKIKNLCFWQNLS